MAVAITTVPVVFKAALQAVVDKSNINPLIPQGRVNETSTAIFECRLGDRDVQLLRPCVIVPTCMVYLGQVHAREDMVKQFILNANLLHQRRSETGCNLTITRGENDILHGEQLFVEIDLDPVFPWDNITLGKKVFEIHLTDSLQESAIKLCLVTHLFRASKNHTRPHDSNYSAQIGRKNKPLFSIEKH
ncbi:hypothetical protein OKS80_17680 [Aeromonas veronii]|nr:hypothetical protein [Aeromonas veronii]MCX9114732.1 hypothetical protein [Aeromonas veronii]